MGGIRFEGPTGSGSIDEPTHELHVTRRQATLPSGLVAPVGKLEVEKVVSVPKPATRAAIENQAAALGGCQWPK